VDVDLGVAVPQRYGKVTGRATRDDVDGGECVSHVLIARFGVVEDDEIKISVLRLVWVERRDLDAVEERPERH
jgi:hypothetical protein